MDYNATYLNKTVVVTEDPKFGDWLKIYDGTQSFWVHRSHVRA